MIAEIDGDHHADGRHIVITQSPDPGIAMTYPPQHHQAPIVSGAMPPNNDWRPAPKPERSRLMPWLLGLLAISVIGAVGLVAVAAMGFGPSSVPGFGEPALTEATAQRTCRTAFEKEFDARMADGDRDIITTVQQIELQETVKTDAGYMVNGTVHFTLTAALLNPVQDTVNLTCAATGPDSAPTTSVANRG